MLSPTILTSMPYKTAKENLTVAPALPLSNELVAQEIKFSGGKKYNVYSAPAKDSVRGGNGKAAVSTNSWIQVFGQEGDWILIQYSIDASRYRIGYIAASALPKNVNVPSLDFQPIDAWVEEEVSLTDDPFYSQSVLAALSVNEKVTWLATIGDWAYVEVTHGKLMRGFVPLESIRTDRLFDLAVISNGLAEGNVRITAEGKLYCNISLITTNQPDRLIVTDSNGTQLAVLSSHEQNTYQNEVDIMLPSSVRCLCLFPQYADGTIGAELCRIQW